MLQTPNLSRRQWLASSLSLAAAAPLLGPPRLRTIGVQLYTVRGTLMKESDHVIKTIAEIGYKEIEGAGRADLIALLPLIRQYGMSAVSCHVETPLITGDWEKYKGMKQVPVEEAIESVKKPGCSTSPWRTFNLWRAAIWISIARRRTR